MDELRVGLRRLADAWAGPVDEVRRDGDDAFVLHRTDGRPAGSRGDLIRLRGIVGRRENDDLRIAPQYLFGGELRVRARCAGRDVHTARDLDEVMDVRPGADGEDLRGIRRVDLVVDARLGRRGRGLGPHVVDALLDVARHRLAVAPDGAAQQDRGAGDIAGALRVDDDHEQSSARELLDRPVGELHDEDKVRLQRDDLLEIDLDAADLLELARLGRLSREAVHADNARPAAEREQELGDRRTDGNDALGALGDGDGAVLKVRDAGRERGCGHRGGRGGLRALGGWGRGATGGGDEKE